MKRQRPAEKWTAVRVRRRWGCLAVLGLFAFLGAAALFLFLILVRPSAPPDPRTLVGPDVDGLVLIELHRGSARTARLLRVLIRPLAFEVQSHPTVLERDLSRLLDAFTHRRAIGLLRHDPDTGREQWAWVVGLKRMGGPLKVLVTQWATRESSGTVETLASEGVLQFWTRTGNLHFAIGRNALLVANDRDWLHRTLDRLALPPNEREIAPQADRLCGALPKSAKHRVVRACLLTTPPRWRAWLAVDERRPPPGGVVARLCRVLEKAEIAPPVLESLAVAMTVEARGQLRFGVTALCDEASSVTAGQRLREGWPQFSATLLGPAVAATIDPTTSTAGLHLGWITPPVEQMLGLKPADLPTTSPR